MKMAIVTVLLAAFAATSVFAAELSLEGVWETSGMPDELTLDPESGRIFVSCMMDNVVDVLDLSGKRLGGIPVGNEPRGLAIE